MDGGRPVPPRGRDEVRVSRVDVLTGAVVPLVLDGIGDLILDVGVTLVGLGCPGLSGGPRSLWIQWWSGHRLDKHRTRPSTDGSPEGQPLPIQPREPEVLTPVQEGRPETVPVLVAPVAPPPPARRVTSVGPPRETDGLVAV